MHTTHHFLFHFLSHSGLGSANMNKYYGNKCCHEYLRICIRHESLITQQTNVTPHKTQ